MFARSSHSLIKVFLGASLVALLSLGAWADDLDWKTSSLAPALTVETSRDAAQGPVAIVRNTSGVIVTAFAISMGDQTVYVDWFGEEPEGLTPGATYSLPIPVKPDSGPRGNVIEVNAAILKEGAAQGNSPQLNFLTYKRLGRAFETERIRLLLQRLPMTPRDSQGAQVLSSFLGELPRSPQEAIGAIDSEVRLSFPAVRIPDATLPAVRAEESLALAGFLEGVRNAREIAVRETNRIRESAASFQDPSAAARRFEAMRNRYDSLGRKYRRALEGSKGGRL